MSSDARERAPPRRGCEQRLERAEGDDGQSEGLTEREVGHVTANESSACTHLARLATAFRLGDVQHSRPEVEPDDLDAGARDRPGDPSGSAGQLEYWTAGR